MQTETLQSMLAQRLHDAPDGPAVIDGDACLTAAQFDSRIDRMAEWLAGQGIGPGDRVGVWLVNRIEWLILLFALSRRGATLVSINTRYRATETAYLLGKSGARLLVMQPAFRNVDFAAVLSQLPADDLPALERIVVPADTPAPPARLLGRPVTVLEAPRPDVPASPTESADDPGKPESVAILFTTSGTTSRPKLVMHTQHTLASHAANVARANGLDAPGARLLAALPLCGTFGLTGVLAALHAGAPVLLMDVFDGVRAARMVREQAVTHLYGSDEMFRRMLDVVPGPDLFPSARVFGFAAFQPGADEFARAARARGVPLVGLYGSSEVQALFAVQRNDAPPERAVAGGGIPAAADARVRVRRLADGTLAGHGEPGELEIRAPGNFAGYLDDPQATSAAIDADGYFRTGDIGSLYPDGGFQYLTRRGDAIRLGGFLVNPAEIEDELGAMPGVAGAAVIGVTIDGQARCVAFVVQGDGPPIDADRLRAEAGRQMAAFKVPARIWVLEALPVTESANGTKIQRARLREMASERLVLPGDSA